MRLSFVLSALTLASCVYAVAVCKVQKPGLEIFENGVVDQNCCAPLTIIFARGSTELGSTGNFAGPPFFRELRSQLGNAGVLVQGVEYDASLLGLLTDGADGGPAMRTLIKRAKSQCPNTKIIASGYSQGAEVVHNALSDASVAGLVSGAVLFGDPDSRENVGLLPANQVKRFCVPGDLICETGILIVTASHLSYLIFADEAAVAARGFAGV